jgi:Tat protein translocase TatC
MFFLKKLLKFGGGAAANKFKDSEKPFLDHLEDLRVTLMKTVGTLVVATIVAFLFYRNLIAIIEFPLERATGGPVNLVTLGATEGFMGVIKVCLYSAIVCSFPILLYFVGEFIIPGLNKKEKKLIVPVILVSFLLFATGVLFSYFLVIPRAFAFFLQFNEGVGIETILQFKFMVSFVTMLCLVFGLCFELPVVVMTLVKLGLLNSTMMRGTRSYAIVAMFIIAAVITPTPDIFTMSLLAGPMILLYEICIWLAWWMERKEAKAEALEKEQERLELVDRQKRTKQRNDAKDTETTDGSDPDKGGASAGTLTYNPDNEATFKDETEGDDDAESKPAGDMPGDDADSYHSGLTEEIDPTSDAVWDKPASATTGDSSDDPDHDPYHDDPHHYDHGYHEDGYFSGSTDELKRHLREEITADLKDAIKQELKTEILAELREELKGDASSEEDTEA